jgi:hypothetical protein
MMTNKDNIQMLSDVCLKPRILSIATQIANNFLPPSSNHSKTSKHFETAYAKKENKPIFEILNAKCGIVDARVLAIINERNLDAHCDEKLLGENVFGN